MANKSNMTTSQIHDFLKKRNYSPSFINWKDDTIPPTMIWYVPERNEFTSDCGVTIPFNYDIHGEMYHFMWDMIGALMKYYDEKGIHLQP